MRRRLELYKPADLCPREFTERERAQWRFLKDEIHNLKNTWPRGIPSIDDEISTALKNRERELETLIQSVRGRK